jgi:hypothetical protein
MALNLAFFGGWALREKTHSTGHLYVMPLDHHPRNSTLNVR